jgi:hypothetical protein
MSHLLTVFPNNAAEQERYYITNVLKKPQCVSIRQFVQRRDELKGSQWSGEYPDLAPPGHCRSVLGDLQCPED